MDTSTERGQYQLHAWAAIFSILGGLAVVIGAFGAHGLEDKISESALETYRTGVLYHFIHVLGALAVATGTKRDPGKWLTAAFWCFLIGILLFSGSLYLLSIREWTGWETSWLGPITPIGGLFFIIGWLTLSIHFFKRR